MRVRVPLLSVVVPFYNVERYFEECLLSLQNQSLEDLDVVLVDDGSPDGSLAIAERYAAADSRFRIVRQDNRGLGPARNTGVQHARGSFLTFVDSDDVVPAQAYERMVRTLERTGSDMASGDARRFNDLGVRESWVHRDPFARERLSTHVREFPPLALDRMAWNKVYRREYWDAQGFAFPAGLYEDYPVTIRSHVLARRVDVHATPVYYWRERDGGEQSITQRVWELRNLAERVASDEAVVDFVSAEAPELLPVVGAHLLQVDVSALAAAVHRNDPAERPDVLDLTRRLLARIPDEVVRVAPAYDRVQAALVRAGDLPALERLVDHRDKHGKTAPVVRRGRLRGRYYRAFPGFEDPATPCPPEAFEAPRERLTMGGEVLDAWWEGTLLHVDAVINVDEVALDGPPAKGRLRSPGGRVRPLVLEEVRDGSPQAAVRFTIDVADLLDETGHWVVEFELRPAGLVVRGALTVADGPRAQWSAFREVAGGTWVKPVVRGGFGVLVARPPDAVTRLELDGHELVLSGRFAPGAGRPAARRPAVWFGLSDGSDVVPAGIETDDEAQTFVARVDLGRIASHGREDRIAERSSWLARIATGIAPPRPLPLGPAPGEADVVLGSRRVSAVAGPHGELTLHEEYAHPLATAVELGDTTVRISGTIDRPGPLPASFRVRRYVTPDAPLAHELAPVWSGRDFTLEVPVTDLVAAARPLEADAVGAPTPWFVLAVDEDGSTEPVVLDVRRAADAAGRGVVDGAQVRVVLGWMARLALTVEPAGTPRTGRIR